MPAPIKQLVYKDFDFRFKPHPVTGKLATLKNIDAIRQAVRMLVLTNKYERPFRPLLGGNVRAQLFELYGPSTESDIKFQIESAMRSFEPRAELIRVDVVGYPDDNALTVTVTFRPVNSRFATQANIDIERIR